MIFSTITALALSVAAFAAPAPQLTELSELSAVTGLVADVPVVGGLIGAVGVKRAVGDIFTPIKVEEIPVDVTVANVADGNHIARDTVKVESVVVLFTNAKATIDPYVAQISTYLFAAYCTITNVFVILYRGFDRRRNQSWTVVRYPR